MGALVELYPSCAVCGGACSWHHERLCLVCAEWCMRQLIQIRQRQIRRAEETKTPAG